MLPSHPHLHLFPLLYQGAPPYVSMEELRAYIGFTTLMGIVTEPAIDGYWRWDELHYSPIADRISQQRFRDVHHFLYFDHN